MGSPFKETNPIFVDKEPFKEDYHPDTILERDDKIDEYGAALQDIVDGFGPPNVFVYGQTGVGKTAITTKVIEYLEAEITTTDISLTVLTVNCNKRTSTYQVISYLANELSPSRNIKQGTHPDTIWSLIYEQIDDRGGDMLVILDEIDKLGESEQLLYEFPRARSMGDLTNARVGIIGISNNFKFRENLSGRVKSTLCEKEIQFAPYNATELQTILSYYAGLTFKTGVLSDNVLQLCAAFTAQDTGDARMALDLLETAGDIARHEDGDQVTEEHVRLARTEVDRANTREIITERLTTQMQLTLLASTLLVVDPDASATVKEIYALYKRLCETIETNTLSESRVRDHINTLEMFGVIESTERNLGRRGGRTFIYSLVDEPRVIIDTFQDDIRFERGIPASIERLLAAYEDDTRTNFQDELGI
jgi:cell division control protein 6